MRPFVCLQWLLTTNLDVCGRKELTRSEEEVRRGGRVR